MAAGQPAAERRLCRLRERTDEDEDDADVDRASARRVGEQLGHPVGAAGLADDDQAGEEDESAGTGDEDGLHRRGPGVWIGVVVADQEIRRDRGELPEDEQDDELVGQDDAEHRSGEQDEHAGESGQAWLVVAEVAHRVDADQQADAGDDRDHQQGERIETQVDVDPELRDPGERFRDRHTVEHAGRVRRRPQQRRQRCDRGHQECLSAQHLAGGDDADTGDEVEEKEEKHPRCRARPGTPRNT